MTAPPSAPALPAHIPVASATLKANIHANTPVQTLLKDHDLAFEDIVIRRRNAVSRVIEILTNAEGKPRFGDPADNRVIYASPLVDVAANLELVNETIAICQNILNLTHWQIRLLTKSHLLPKIATALEKHKDRLIYGVSTGTLNNKLASSFEQGTALVSKRIESLHWLQDNGFRTFGMICPSLPQTNYLSFANEMAQTLHVDKCEHVWAEVLNVRGKSMIRTVDAIKAGGFPTEASMLEAVSTNENAWENYARETFLAHAQVIPPEKLRFLQYVQTKHLEFWRGNERNGAVLLGAAVESDDGIKAASSKMPSNEKPMEPTVLHLGSKSNAATKAWETMRTRYTPEEISERASKAAYKAWVTMRARSPQ